MSDRKRKFYEEGVDQRGDEITSGRDDRRNSRSRSRERTGPPAASMHSADQTTRRTPGQPISGGDVAGPTNDAVSSMGNLQQNSQINEMQRKMLASLPKEMPEDQRVIMVQRIMALSAVSGGPQQPPQGALPSNMSGPPASVHSPAMQQGMQQQGMQQQGMQQQGMPQQGMPQGMPQQTGMPQGSAMMMQRQAMMGGGMVLPQGLPELGMVQTAAMNAPSYAAAAGAAAIAALVAKKEEEEEDPLDAYMNSVQDELKVKNPKAAKNANSIKDARDSFGPAAYTRLRPQGWSERLGPDSMLEDFRTK